jgi:ABC-type transport system substrate-binding protein/serine/threonine protein kinase
MPGIRRIHAPPGLVSNPGLTKKEHFINRRMFELHNSPNAISQARDMNQYQGQQLGYYRLTRLLGEGGFAQVYLGEHVLLKTQAAIKVLTTHLGQDEMASFLNEAQMIARLRHPNIVRVLDFGLEGNVPFLVMEYAPNGTLRQRHPRGTQLSLGVILPYVQQVAEALHYAHEEKLIHRDIKPENMLIGPRGEVLLSDFGIATLTQSARQGHEQDVAGTVAYMAPEQIQGQPCPASDQYALGVVVYEWLSGDLPFKGTFTEVAAQHTLKSPEPLYGKIPALSPAIERVIMTALEKDPAARFADMRAFVQALEDAARSAGALPETRSGSAASGALPPTQPSGVLGLAHAPDLLTPTRVSPAQQTSFETRPASDFVAVLPASIHAQLTAPPNAPAAPPRPPIRRRGHTVALVGIVLALLVVLSGLGAAGYYLLLNHTTPTAGPYPYTVPTHRGGTLVYGSPYGIDTTNPWFATYQGDYALIDALWGAPLGISSSGTYLPDELAEIPTQANGDVSKDGLTVVMKLRHDLRWSDGLPLTADDFVYWLHVELDPQTNGTYATNGYNQLASYRAQDPYTLILTYKQVFAPYLAYLPLAAPSHAWQNIPDSALLSTPDVALTPQVTSGPFMLSRYIPGDSTSGQRFEMVPNPYYVSTTLHPSVLDHLIFQGYNDLPSAIQAYQRGQLDQVESLQPGDLPSVKGLPGLRVSPLIGYVHLDFNLTNPVLQNVYTRKAIEEAIDRCQIIQSVFQQPCNSLRVDTILPKPSPDFDPTNQAYAFNLTQARADLQNAGWDCSTRTCLQNGQPFPTLHLVTYSNALYGAIELLIQHDLAALGIQVSMDIGNQNLFGDFTHGGVLATGSFELALIGYDFTIDSDQNLYAIFHSSQIPSAQNPTGQNFERVNNTDVDELLDEGRTTLDSAQRSQDYKDVQHILIQEVYVVPLFLEPDITLTSPLIGNYLTNPTYLGNEWNIGDWYLTG